MKKIRNLKNTLITTAIDHNHYQQIIATENALSSLDLLKHYNIANYYNMTYRLRLKIHTRNTDFCRSISKQNLLAAKQM